MTDDESEAAASVPSLRFYGSLLLAGAIALVVVCPVALGIWILGGRLGVDPADAYSVSVTGGVALYLGVAQLLWRCRFDPVSPRERI